MLVTVQSLLNEHEAIEQELIELETIMDCETINYPNLVHVLSKLDNYLNEHEHKEDLFFRELVKKGIPIPKKVSLTHGQLKNQRKNLQKGLASGSEQSMREALDRHGKGMIESLRNHMKEEEWIFYALPRSNKPLKA